MVGKIGMEGKGKRSVGLKSSAGSTVREIRLTIINHLALIIVLNLKKEVVTDFKRRWLVKNIVQPPCNCCD